METYPDTAKIISLAAAREATRKNRQNPHDGSHDAPNDGAMTACHHTDDGLMTGNDAPVTAPMTAYDGACKRLQSQAMIQWLREQYTPEEAAAVMTGALLLARDIKPGEECNATEMIKAAVTEEFSYRMLTDKCKPMLVHAGIWRKNNANKFQWVNWKKPPERANAANESANVLQMEQGQRANATPRMAITPQRIIDKLTIARASRDPYSHIEYGLNGNPIITRHRRPFSGELTEPEKAAIRTAQEQAAYAKLLGTSGQASPKAVELAEQLQLQRLRRKHEQEAQWDTLKLWGKVLAAIGAAAFIATTIGTGAQPADNQLPQGIQVDGQHGQ